MSHEQGGFAEGEVWYSPGSEPAPPTPAPAYTHEDAPTDEGSPGYWWRTIEARQADLARVRDDEQKAREASGAAVLREGVADARLLGEVAKTQALVASLEDAIRQGHVELAAAEKRQTRQRALAVFEDGRVHADKFMETSERLQAAIETMAAEYLELLAHGNALGRAIGKANILVPPKMRNDGRVFAGDARESLQVTELVCERILVEITRRVGRHYWPKCPDRPAAVLNCPLHDQHRGIVVNAITELATTLNVDLDASLED